MEDRVALVVGAHGVIGGNLIRHLKSTGEWTIHALSRRGGESTDGVHHIAVDLLDRDDAISALRTLHDVTHIFYAAYQDRPTWAELVQPNMQMLENVIDAIEPVAQDLRHVSLMQGYKVYGAHLGPFRTPAREDSPGFLSAEFNTEQQQFVESRSARAKWNWTAMRPSVVCGFGIGNPMNLATVIAVYASMSREMNVPLRFPGKQGAFSSLLEMTDADLLAEATVWAATTDECANNAFNITNGDLFRWETMWPSIARFFDLEVADPLRMSLTETMSDKEPLWTSMVDKYDLQPTPYSDVAAWPFGDFVFGWDYDFFADSSKARRFGFHRYVETEKMFVDIFSDLRRRRIIP
ncbi:SDR family oxidoreductase [Rhodococcoides kyotonense]|uniref:Nucleoside-diphosphate-sugar epimerase n=1 Tax=Rhodococcoides kyotonense TaxID=398843 RepID=A0A239L8Q6_9NOCA|nr:SDR family oxidoreductase [Rhodococcus kyotonensis]SNT26288.1 Nucleoside-diphosphate-sugar epimerase [Rhodococcus kyotonensis]